MTTIAAVVIPALYFFVFAQVLMKGYMTNHADPKALNCIGNWYKPWFFTHVASFLKSGA